MGQCVSRSTEEYDAEAPLVGGTSPVRGLMRPLRRLIGRREVLFWGNKNLTGSAIYSFRLTPPFVLTHFQDGRTIIMTILMTRVQEEERCDQLVFQGVCRQGFIYTATVRANNNRQTVENDVTVSVWRRLGQRWRWRLCEKRRMKQQYIMQMRWIKAVKRDDDYAVDYEMWLYR